jgi:endonuclease/exonuclease/phosphatase family metal-dependent hydrolase
MLQRVIIEVDGLPVHIYNTHLPPEESIQEAQVPVILRQVSKDRERPRDFAFRPVLMGDFNAKPDSDAYRRITQGPFNDAWRAVYGNTNGCNIPPRCEIGFDPKGCTFKTFCPQARIDYIFIGNDDVFSVEDAQVTSNRALFNVFFGLGSPNERDDFNKVPDHLPVVARLSLRLLNAQRLEGARPIIARSFPFSPKGDSK